MNGFASMRGPWWGAAVAAMVVWVALVPRQAAAQVRKLSSSEGSVSELKQSRQALERERKRLEADVELTARLIAQTQATQKRSLSELRLLDRQITLRRELLRTNEAEIDALEAEIDELEGVVGAMHTDLDSMKRSYGRLAMLAYKVQNKHSALLWLLASEDFAQAYDRLMVLRELRRFRAAQIGLIRRSQGRVDRELAALNARRSEKQDLLIARKAEKQRLDRNRSQKNQTLAQLKAKQGSYQQQLSSYRQRLAAVQRDIERLIKEEIDRAARAEAAARARANRGGRPDPTDAVTLAERENLKRLSALFEKNQGRLPWPVAANRAVITGSFGRSEDPTGGTVQNDGISLSTEGEQPIRAVFNGKVTHVRSNRVIGTVVIIQHGRYRSVYVNLTNVLVKEGDEVSTLQPIGTVAPEAEGRAGGELQFLIYHDRTPVNPQAWIVPKSIAAR